MGKTPAQKRVQAARGVKPKKRRKKPADPRTSEIVPRAGQVKITRADGTVEFQSPKKATKLNKTPYAPPRPKKMF